MSSVLSPQGKCSGGQIIHSNPSTLDLEVWLASWTVTGEKRSADVLPPGRRLMQFGCGNLQVAALSICMACGLDRDLIAE